MREHFTDRCGLPSPARLIGLLLAAAVSVGGCTASRSPANSPLLSQPWVSPIDREHPLVGKVYDVHGGRTIEMEDLSRVLERTDFVLLGEQHDNVDHHRLQAGLLAGMIASNRKPAVAFEQIDLERQQAVDNVLGAVPSPSQQQIGPLATQVSIAARWSTSGWPPFDQYRPIFETALSAGLPICAANLSRALLINVMTQTAKKAPKDGPAFPDAGLLAQVPLPDAARASMAADVEDSHCGYANPNTVDAMVEAQRRRDAMMADSLGVADVKAAWRGAVLIAGFGHVRRDYGVPLYVRHFLPARSVVSVAFLEVSADLRKPEDYAARLHATELPFDYVVFTPGADDKDPCETFKKGLEKLEKR